VPPRNKTKQNQNDMTKAIWYIYSKNITKKSQSTKFYSHLDFKWGLTASHSPLTWEVTISLPVFWLKCYFSVGFTCINVNIYVPGLSYHTLPRFFFFLWD
jgi:hypothetical protein